MLLTLSDNIDLKVSEVRWYSPASSVSHSELSDHAVRADAYFRSLTALLGHKYCVVSLAHAVKRMPPNYAFRITEHACSININILYKKANSSFLCAVE